MAGDIDLSQFESVFFEESLENLAVVESGLLALGEDPGQIDAVFRAAHSIKGGAGTFGFDDLAKLTHAMETLLDLVRQGDQRVTPDLIDALLAAADHIRAMLENGGRDPNGKRLLELVQRLEGSFSDESAAVETSPSEGPAKAAGDGGPPTGAPAAPSTDGEAGDVWAITFTPRESMLLSGNDPFRIIRELETLGDLGVRCELAALPEMEAMSVQHCYLRWELRLAGDVSRERIEEVFDWVMDECDLEIREERTGVFSDAAQPVVREEPDAIEEPLEADSGKGGAEDWRESVLADEISADTAPRVAATPAPEEPARQPAPATDGLASADAAIRINITKIDGLINLVGELIITQSMIRRLALDGLEGGEQQLAAGIAQLHRNSRELQEQAMSIRMLPFDSLLQKMPRAVRDFCRRTGKELELELAGTETELDRPVLEKLDGPLLQLLQNAMDHGIEAPEERVAAGKDRGGVISVTASHEGGNAVITVTDDGRGVDAAALRDQAIARSVVAADSELTTQETLNLLFPLAGASRGGLEKVRSAVAELNGQIRVSSTLGGGTTFTLVVPLTLSIIDGQLVRLGEEIFVIPMRAIIKSMRMDREHYTDISGQSEIYHFQEDGYIPVLRLHEVYGLPADHQDIEEAILVVIDGERRYGVLVDEVIGQQQVVMKALDDNYRSVTSVAGATILGDGRVAMVLDTNGLLNYAQSARARAGTGSVNRP